MKRVSLPASDLVEGDTTNEIMLDEDVNGSEHIGDDLGACATQDENDDKDIENLTAQLTSREIDHLQMAIFDKNNALSGCVLLESEHLSPPPDPKHIKARLCLEMYFMPWTAPRFQPNMKPKKHILSHYRKCS